MNALTTRRPVVDLAWVRDRRDLLGTLLRRELRARYKATAAGIFWSYLNPLLMMAVYTIVFSILWRSPEPHYPLVVLTGLAIWTLFQSAVIAGTGALVYNADLLKKVAFPREIVPLATVLAQLVTPAVMLAVLVPVCLVVTDGAWKVMPLALVSLAGCTCLALGITWTLAALNVLFRDVEHLVNVVMMPLFFLTPVLYRMENLPGGADNEVLVTALRWGNPVTPYVESFRAAFLDGQLPGWPNLVYVVVVGPAVALVGLLIFQRLGDRVAVEL